MSIWQVATTAEFLTERGSKTLPGHLGIRVTEIGPDYLRASMPVHAHTHQPFGALHGGASVALAETVASVGGYMNVDPAREHVVGIEINANHLRAKRDGEVRAVATPIHVGRRTQVWDVRIADEEGRLVCVSRCTLAVVPSTPEGTDKG